MRRVLRRILIALVALAVVAGALAGIAAAGGGGSTITRPRLERALPAVFTNLYVQQARLVGHDDVTAARLGARAMCDKHGPLVPDVGPGGDWVCLMSWQDPHLPMPAEGYGKFELNVHSNDCFTATGPSKLIGFITVTDTAGREVPNPVAEFDGCFDPATSNAPTGVSFASLLTVTSTGLTRDRTGRTSVQLNCGMGEQGCVGTLTAGVGTRQLGRMPLQMSEESTDDLLLPWALPRGATQITLRILLRTGVGPTSVLTLPLG
jgi:hypothetical protein